MAQLDKTFPTNDCSMCILSPKLVEAQRHPNIEILVNSEITECAGKEGDFKVKVLQNARFVDEVKCTGCGACAEKCPKSVPNDFEEGMKDRKAIYIPFPQAVPLKYTIDKDNCIYFEKGKCRLCEKTCESNAVDFEQKDSEIKLNIGSIVVATGYDQFHPSVMGELGYDRYDNVITGLEFERMLNASGPTEGRIFLPDTEQVPRSITFIQCVGSRDENHCSYCSRVCCMYAVKEAMLAKEHESDITDLNILYMDMRAYGKGFEEYLNRCQDEIGAKFLRGRVSEISKSQDHKKLQVRFENTISGEPDEISTDMVVLSSALIPSSSTQKLAKVLDIELDDDGFILEAGKNNPQETSKNGIYVCGCAKGPRDIPDSVASASAASALAQAHVKDRIQDIAEDSGKTEHGDVQKQQIETEDPKIGIFVCSCGINISGTVDVDKVAEHARTLPNVVDVQNNLFTCSESTQHRIKEAIKKNNLNRVIVAACTPRTHEPLFRETCYEAGLNPYLFEMTNIREHCSWVHSQEKEDATEKAKELLEMAVARASKLRPLSRKTVNIKQKALVVGGGAAGIQAALDLSKGGFPTYLIEKTSELGGRLNDLFSLSPSNETATKLLKDKLAQLNASDVEVHTDSEISEIEGFVGNFQVRIRSTENKGSKDESILEVGALLIAIGSEIYQPSDLYSYGKNPNVITHLDLERELKDEESSDKKNQEKYIFINCVGARDREGYTGCSRYCCQVSVKQAVDLVKNGNSATILHRDIRTFGKGAEDMYMEARELGVSFVRYGEDNIPKISDNGKSVKVYDTLLQEDINLESDKIVLVVPMVPPQDAELFQNMLKIPRGPLGFFLEQHPKLAPLSTNTDGIFLAGCVQGPKNVEETITQASGAASQAIALLSHSEKEVEAAVATVRSEMCWGCGTCVEVCEFNAPNLVSVEPDRIVSQINEALCKGCGTCAVSCPSGAVSPQHFTREQIIEMINAFGGRTRA
jgi:heterodisulfide reductase subunit A